MKFKPIQPEEIPEQFRKDFDFESQKTVNNHLRILRTCPDCGNQRMVYGSNLRRRARNGNITSKCDRCHSWKGGRKIENGYVLIYNPGHPRQHSGGYTLEHRSVMEQHLNRFLLPSETVHHKNGVKSDNRIENLELRNGNHGSGQRYEDLSTEQIAELINHLASILVARTP